MVSPSGFLYRIVLLNRQVEIPRYSFCRCLDRWRHAHEILARRGGILHLNIAGDTLWVILWQSHLVEGSVWPAVYDDAVQLTDKALAHAFLHYTAYLDVLLVQKVFACQCLWR